MQVYLEYADTESAVKARQGLNGRKFGGNEVVAVFYPEDKFWEGDYSGQFCRLVGSFHLFKFEVGFAAKTCCDLVRS